VNTPSSSSPLNVRTVELLAERAISGISDSEKAELAALLAESGRDDDFSFDLAAALIETVYLDPAEIVQMPPGAAARLNAVGLHWAAQRSTGSNKPGLLDQPASTESLPFVATKRSTFLPWAIAACATIAAVSLWMRHGQTPSAGGDVQSVIAAASDATTLIWKDWDNPEIPGVKGSVVWSESKQTGVMKFTGLPKNDPAKSQYQLWIIDSRGMNQRISGAIFNAVSDGSIEIVVRPQIAVKSAAAFAITIEEPGGTWVSEMKRRVVISAKG